MWAQVYGAGDEYSREKAVAALDELLPDDAAVARSVRSRSSSR